MVVRWGWGLIMYKNFVAPIKSYGRDLYGCKIKIGFYWNLL